MNDLVDIVEAINRATSGENGSRAAVLVIVPYKGGRCITSAFLDAEALLAHRDLANVIGEAIVIGIERGKAQADDWKANQEKGR